MKHKIKKIISVLGILLIPICTYAQTANYWYPVSNSLRPIINTYGLSIPSLGSTGNPCVKISNTSGLFATTTCGTGGGSFSTNPFTATYFTATGTTATSTIPLLNVTNSLILGNNVDPAATYYGVDCQKNNPYGCFDIYDAAGNTFYSFSANDGNVALTTPVFAIESNETDFNTTGVIRGDGSVRFSNGGFVINVAGDTTVNSLTNKLCYYDGTSSCGTFGQVLESTSTGSKWVSTSTLGFLASSSIGIGTTGQIPYYSSNGRNLTATSTIFLSNGLVGIGSTTPSANFSIHSNSGLAGTAAIFNIASSTSAGLATTTLFTVLGNGAIISNASATSTFAQNILLSSLGTQQSPAIESGTVSNNAGIYWDSNGGFCFTTKNSTTVSGGIFCVSQFGNTSTGRLTVNGGSNSANGIGIAAATAGLNDDWGFNGITFSTNSIDRAEFSSSTGYFGWGTTTPAAPISIQAISTNPATSSLFIIASSSVANTATTTLFNVLGNGHLITGGQTPSVSGGTSSVVGNDSAGTITVVGTALTSVTLTFAQPWGINPVCTESDNSTALTADISSVSTTSVTFGFSIGINSGTLWYQCVQ